MGKCSGNFIGAAEVAKTARAATGGKCGNSAPLPPLPPLPSLPPLGSPTQHAPTIDVQHLPRDVPRQVRAQKHDRSGDVLDAGNPSEGDGPCDLLFAPSAVL